MPDNQQKTEPRKKSPYRILFWIIFVFAIILILMPRPLGTRRAAQESRAKSTLRSTGSSQLAYQDTNNLKSYGSFQNLVDSLYIADGYSLSNMIENYSMTWEIGSSSVVQTEGPVVFDRFTIVAYPRNRFPGYNKTFAVTEDQIVRVYVPEDNDFNSIKTWDPIM